MNLKNLFHSFKLRLIAEAIIRSAISALTLASLIVFAVSLIYHIFITEASIAMMAVLFAIVFILCLIFLYFLNYRPKDLAVAARIDQLGFQERILTMVKLQKDDREIAKLQRQDALNHLHDADPRKLRITFSKKRLIFCVISAAAAVTMISLPYNLFAGPEDNLVNAKEQEMIVKDLLEQLREEISQSEVTDDLKEELNEIVDDLEERLEESSSELEKAAQISESRQQIREAIAEAMEQAQEQQSAESEMQVMEAEQQTLDEMLEDAMDEMLGNEAAEGEMPPGEGEALEGEMPPGEGEAPEGEMPPGEGEPPQEELQEGSQGSGEEQEDTRTEKFYDPVSGEIEYGKMYAAYYSQYLSRLEQEDMPEDLKNINDRYYELLN